VIVSVDDGQVIATVSVNVSSPVKVELAVIVPTTLIVKIPTSANELEDQEINLFVESVVIKDVD